MKYLLLIYHEETQWSQLNDAERQEFYIGYRSLREQLQESKQFIDGSQLQPTANATSVRIRGAEALVTDGPFAETKEQLAGYFLVEAKDLDEAIAIAKKIPSAKMGTIEVRALI